MPSLRGPECPVCLNENRPALAILDLSPADIGSHDQIIDFHNVHAEWSAHSPGKYTASEEPMLTCSDPDQRHYVCQKCFKQLLNLHAPCPLCRGTLPIRKKNLRWSVFPAVFWHYGYTSIVGGMRECEQDVNECLGQHKISLLFEAVRSVAHLEHIPFSYIDRLQCVRLLLRKGADPHKRNRHGSAILHFAAHVDTHGLIVKALLLSGALVDAIDEYGSTALHIAARSNHISTVRVLLEWSPKILEDKVSRATVLHVAAEHAHLMVGDMVCKYVRMTRGQEEMQKLICQKDNSGKTAKDLCPTMGGGLIE